jgi:hypothetical protein
VNSSLARLKKTSLDGNRRSSMSRRSKTDKQSSDSQQSATSAKPEGETPKISMLLTPHKTPAGSIFLISQGATELT